MKYEWKCYEKSGYCDFLCDDTVLPVMIVTDNEKYFGGQYTAKFYVKIKNGWYINLGADNMEDAKKEAEQMYKEHLIGEIQQAKQMIVAANQRLKRRETNLNDFLEWCGEHE